MPAERLASAGAINHVVPTATLESFCLSLAEQIQSNAPLTIRTTKEMMNVLLVGAFGTYRLPSLSAWKSCVKMFTQQY